MTEGTKVNHDNIQLTHVHHWIIDEAHGPTSEGRCKRCGTAKAFRNWLEETDFITNEEHRTAA